MNLLSVLSTLLTNVPAEIQLVETAEEDLQAAAALPGVASFLTTIENLFHISSPTAGSATVIEPKTTVSTGTKPTTVGR